MDQVTENLKSASKAEANSLTAQEVTAIDQVKAIFKERIKVNCTACGYCMPCPEGVNIPSCFAMYNSYHMFGNEENYNARFPDKQKASSCVECGECETHCPQGISIRQELRMSQLSLKRLYSFSKIRRKWTNEKINGS